MLPLTVAEVAKLLNVPKSTVIAHIKNGELKDIYLSKRTIRIKNSSVNRFLEEIKGIMHRIRTAISDKIKGISG